ncbi:hypothetical protein [Streptomyces coerulescens]|uniref:Uncharacterized protein n=1 Tax=Streptomyces coerulescens TaxID=29304 RepID=A0ABW0CB31_STRCD
MSEQVRGDGAAFDRERTPETGAVRMNDDGLVEHYDGTAWRPYGELPDDGSGPAGTWQFRADNRDDGPTRP